MATKKPHKTSVLKWVILFVATGIVDVFQIVADFTGVGVAVSEAIEPFVGVGLVATCELMKIHVLTKPKRLASMIGALGFDALTGGAAPLWIIDVWYIYYDTKKEEAAEQAAFDAKNSQDNVRQQIYKDGRREPVSGTSTGNTPGNGYSINVDASDTNESGDDTTSSNTFRNPNTRPLVVDGVRAPSK